MAPPDRRHPAAVFPGQFARLFWFTQIGGVLLPVLLLTLPRIHWIPRLRDIPMLQPRPALVTVASYAAAMIVLSLVAPQTAALEGVDVARMISPWVLTVMGIWLFLAMLPVFHDRPIAAAVVAAVLGNVAAWLKRFVILVPKLQNPFLPIQRAPAGWAIY